MVRLPTLGPHCFGQEDGGTGSHDRHRIAGGGASESWAEASAKAASKLAGTGARGGTDARVAGWAAVGRQLAAREPHRPYSDDPWHAPADPAEAAKIPWCGHRDCDPDTRLRPGATPQDKPDPCQVCHPILRF